MRHTISGWCNSDREYQTKTWLDCETEMDAGSKVVNKLKCTSIMFVFSSA